LAAPQQEKSRCLLPLSYFRNYRTTHPTTANLMHSPRVGAGDARELAAVVQKYEVTVNLARQELVG